MEESIIWLTKFNVQGLLYKVQHIARFSSKYRKHMKYLYEKTNQVSALIITLEMTCRLMLRDRGFFFF